jgi:hypothetical protein
LCCMFLYTLIVVRRYNLSVVYITVIAIGILLLSTFEAVKQIEPDLVSSFLTLVIIVVFLGMGLYSGEIVSKLKKSHTDDS